MTWKSDDVIPRGAMQIFKIPSDLPPITRDTIHCWHLNHISNFSICFNDHEATIYALFVLLLLLHFHLVSDQSRLDIAVAAIMALSRLPPSLQQDENDDTHVVLLVVRSNRQWQFWSIQTLVYSPSKSDKVYPARLVGTYGNFRRRKLGRCRAHEFTICSFVAWLSQWFGWTHSQLCQLCRLQCLWIVTSGFIANSSLSCRGTGYGSRNMEYDFATIATRPW